MGSALTNQYREAPSLAAPIERIPRLPWRSKLTNATASYRLLQLDRRVDPVGRAVSSSRYNFAPDQHWTSWNDPRGSGIIGKQFVAPVVAPTILGIFQLGAIFLFSIYFQELNW
jgi:hypothetical protein